MRSYSVSKAPLLLTLAVASFASLSQPVQAAALIDQAILTDGNLAVTGGAYIYGKVHTNANFNIDGGSTITGFTSAVGTITNDPGFPGFLLGGSQAGAPAVTYPTMLTVLGAIGAVPDHEIFGNLILSGSNPFSGIYLVHGFIDISSDAMGTATFLADGNIDISSFGGSVTGAVLNSNFPFGLALFSANGYVNVSGDDPIRGSIAAKTTANVSNTSPVVAPEPSSALLLGLGCLGAVMTRKRKTT